MPEMLKRDRRAQTDGGKREEINVELKIQMKTEEHERHRVYRGRRTKGQ